MDHLDQTFSHCWKQLCVFARGVLQAPIMQICRFKEV